jgi:hypothetical protein
MFRRFAGRELPMARRWTTQRWRKPTSGAWILLVLALLVVASIVGAGLWAGGGSLAFLSGPTPKTIYVTPEPGPTDTASAPAESPPVTPAPTASSTSSPTASPTVPPATSPTLEATATPTTVALTSTPPPRPPTPAPARPNLAFSSVVLDTPYCSEMGTARARVANNGPVPTGRSVEVRLTGKYEDTVHCVGSRTVPPLDAGEVTWITFSVDVSLGCGGEHEFTFELDPTHVLAESDELDNVRTAICYIERNLPNLRVASVTLSTGAPKCLLAFDVRATIANVGPRSTGRDGLLRLVDRVGLGTTIATRFASFDPIAAGSSATVSIRLTLGPEYCGVTHQLVLTVDYDNVIEEFDETDNGYFESYMLSH